MIISKVTIIACVLVVMASMSAAQFYAGKRQWFDTFGPQTDTPPATSTSTTTTNTLNNNGLRLGDRNPFLTPVESASFKFYNNVPIEGPGMPCIGCVYRLTSNGFVMVRP
ncbi:Hypothetical predicted protein [Cloeon dipterum]|uniref:Secreted protein n=1 Tax=Cloeon dipterum TaxID=197152 RepID=A0A8S1CE44_9INSE|nr:Hypothetical predicted protein [Cloeon dipterum]